MIKKTIKRLLRKTGYAISHVSESVQQTLLNDILTDDEFMSMYDFCKPYTMSSIEPMYALHKSIAYIIENKIPGHFVECGVWKGGSAMIIAKYLALHNIKNRNIYLYDTFEGMTMPTESDINFKGEFARDRFDKSATGVDSSSWCYSSLEEVKQNMSKTGFSETNIFYFKGKVEDTIPKHLPDNKISLLRLDTDWYESTKHELHHLYPMLAESGVLIIDDYGHWEGAKKAVVEYFQEHKVKMLLNRIDYSARIGIKTLL